MVQIMVKQWPKMVEGSSRYDPPKSILVPPEKTKNDQFWSFSGLSEPSVVGDYKKSASRASPACMSLERMIHDANYGVTMAGNG